MSLALIAYRNQRPISGNSKVRKTQVFKNPETQAPVDGLGSRNGIENLGLIQPVKENKPSKFGARIKQLAKGALAVASGVALSVIAAPSALASSTAAAGITAGLGAIAAPIAAGAGIGAVAGYVAGTLVGIPGSFLSLGGQSIHSIAKKGAVAGAAVGGAIGATAAGGGVIVGSMVVGGVAAGMILKN